MKKKKMMKKITKTMIKTTANKEKVAAIEVGNTKNNQNTQNPQKIIVINKATPWLETVILLFVFMSSLQRTEWYWEMLKYFTGTLLIIHTITLVMTIVGQMKQGEKMPDYLNPDNYKKA